MKELLIAAVVEEIAPELAGRAFGKVWQLGRAALAFDFRLKGDRYLFVSTEPSAPRLHLVSRRVRDLERRSQHPSAFVLTLRKQLGGAVLLAVAQDAGERVVRFRFEAYDAAGEPLARTLVAQLTGRTANLFLLDSDSRVVDSLRPARGDGQETGETYQPPTRPPASAAATNARRRDSHPTARQRDALPTAEQRGPHASLSAALDEHFRALEAAREFDARAGSALSRLRREIERRRKLEGKLAEDERAHGDAEEHRRAGDLLLANLATAERAGARVRLIDYFAEDAPTIEIEIDERATLQEEAARRFALYARAKRAAQEIARRRRELAAELDALEARRAELERINAARDEAALAAFEDAARPGNKFPRRPAAGKTRGGDPSRAVSPSPRADSSRTDSSRTDSSHGDSSHGDSSRGVGAARGEDALRGGADAARVGGSSRGDASHRDSARGETANRRAQQRGESSEAVPGARRYVSSDGYEILVGRAARDNDHLTFKIARPHDLWLHAADYPGSHVVVRNHARGADVPQRTVHEAAQLAAHFSQARRDAKVAVNYTQRKFLSKPKGSAPGLVRISSFRTLLVEPREGVERI